MRCGSCGTDSPPDARLCMSYGAEVLEADAQEVPRTVTNLFSDVSGSTAMGDALDPESVRRVVSRHFDECRSVIEFHGDARCLSYGEGITFFREAETVAQVID